MKPILALVICILVFAVSFLAFSSTYAIAKLLVIGVIIALIIAAWKRRKSNSLYTKE
jgi:predicted benzoate:H+ symporter BenE